MTRLSQIVRIGRKYAIYLPKSIVDKLMLQEGDKLAIKAEENQIILKPLPKLLTKSSYWAETTIQ